MAKKAINRSRRFTQTRPDAPPDTNNRANLQVAVIQALQDIDSMQGPPDPKNPANPLYPGWVRMSTQEKIRAVVDAMDADPTVAMNIGSLTVRFEKEVRDAYETKHRRTR